MRDLLKRSILLGLLILAASLFSVGKSSAFGLTSARVIDDPLPRRPLGVYAKVNIEETKKEIEDRNTKKGIANTPDIIHAEFLQLYARLLANPAIAGIAVGAHWDHIEFAEAPYPQGYDWSYLDDAFAAVSQSPTPKSIQLIITPGFVSPKWLIDKLPSCDGLFHDGPELVPPNCGKVSFEGFPEEQRDDGNIELPLPWNPTYQQEWSNFLGHLNDRYNADANGNPNPAFVAIAVAGPIGASDEIILPTSDNVTVSPRHQPSGLPVDETWARVIAYTVHQPPSYVNSDQVFVDSWTSAFNTYEGIFSGLTLTLGPDGGRDMPQLGSSPIDSLLYAPDCIGNAGTNRISCGAKAAIISSFISATSQKDLDRKATQIGGLTASSNEEGGNIGLYGVKLLTSWSPPFSPPFLGGAEFDHAVSGTRTKLVGCPIENTDQCGHLTVEEAAYNVLAVFFDHTPAASYFSGGLTGTVTEQNYQRGNAGSQPMDYLEVPYADVLYANKHQCVSKPSDVIGYMSVQQMLDQAKHDLLGIADGTLPAQDSTPPVTTTTLPAPTGLHGWYQGPTVVDFSATDDLSGVVRTEWSLDNQTTWTPFECDRLHLRDDGVYNVLTRSTDLAGKVEVPKLTIVMIDSTAPVTTVATNYIKGKTGPISLVVSFTASDNLSGVARTEYSLDNGSHWKTGPSLALNESGKYTILFRSTDVAGNVEKRNSIKLNVSVNPPTQPR